MHITITLKHSKNFPEPFLLKECTYFAVRDHHIDSGYKTISLPASFQMN